VEKKAIVSRLSSRASHEAARYYALKTAWAAEHRHDREACTDAKTSYVEEVTAKASA